VKFRVRANQGCDGFQECVADVFGTLVQDLGCYVEANQVFDSATAVITCNLQSAGVDPVVDPESDGLPSDVTFSVAGPNPTGTVATLRYGLPRASRISAKAFDVSGRTLRDLGKGEMQAGWHSLSWDLHDAAGSRVGPGIYFVGLSVDGRRWVQPVTVLR
jgi:hypothetical protein